MDIPRRPPSRRLAKSALDSYLVEDGFLIGLGEGRKKGRESVFLLIMPSLE